MGGDELVASLQNTAYTTGAGANCYFQAFIHTLCAQNDDVIAKMDAFPSTKDMINEFNETVQDIHVANMLELISVARAMHPLEREVIFGTIMRNTFNRLELEDANGNKLALSEGTIVNPQHTIPFAHAFGFSLDVYTLSTEAGGMPQELKRDPLIVGDVTFYREHCPLAHNIGELILRLKSCHFEVAGLNSEYVQEHQSKIIPATINENNGDRLEAPGARYYEKPSVPKDCAIANAGVSFDIAVSRTVSALMEREGDHQRLMTINSSLQSTLRSELSKMTYEDFDNYMRSGKGGEGEKAAEALIHYLSDAEEKLNDKQKFLLNWHAGQDYAKAGNKDLAITHFRLAGNNKAEMESTFGPGANAYYNATIGFLENDRRAVTKAYATISNTNILEYPFANVVFIPGRIHDMYEAMSEDRSKTTYKDIFDLPASLPPLPGEENWHTKPDGKPEYEFDQEYRDALSDALNQEQMIQSEFGQESDTAKKFGPSR